VNHFGEVVGAAVAITARMARRRRKNIRVYERGCGVKK